MKKTFKIWLNTYLTGSLLMLIWSTIPMIDTLSTKDLLMSGAISLCLGLISLILSIHCFIWFKISDYINPLTPIRLKGLLYLTSWLMTVAITYLSVDFFLAKGGYFPRFASPVHRDPLLIPTAIIFGISGLLWTIIIHWDKIRKPKINETFSE